MHHHSFEEEIISNIQPAPPLAQTEAVPSGPITVTWEKSILLSHIHLGLVLLCFRPIAVCPIAQPSVEVWLNHQSFISFTLMPGADSDTSYKCSQPPHSFYGNALLQLFFHNHYPTAELKLPRTTMQHLFLLPKKCVCGQESPSGPYLTV